MPKSAAPSKDTQGFDFDKIKPQLSSLLGDWNNNEKSACEARRAIRLLETNVEIATYGNHILDTAEPQQGGSEWLLFEKLFTNRALAS